MRIVGPLLVALAMAAACAPGGGTASTASPRSGDTPTTTTSTPTETHPAKTPTPGPVATPTSGSGWRYAYVSEQPDSHLRDVTAAGPDDAWAAGTSAGRLLLLHYDGDEWRPADPPPGVRDLPPESDVHIAASAPDNVWVLVPKISADEQVSGMTAFRWDGSGWHRLPSELDTGIVADFEVLGPDDAWTVHGVDQPYASRWDGRTWNKVPLPANAESLSGTGTADLWAVGARHSGPVITKDELSQPAAMHWDGRGWRLVPTPTYAFAEPKPPEGSAGLDEVVALSPDEVWAVGTHTYNHGEVEDEPANPPPILLRWDGRRWTEHRAPGSRYCCPQLAGDGSGGILVVPGGPGLRDTWRLGAAGQRSRVARLPAIPGLKRSQFFAVEGLAGAPRSSTVWAVGQLEADGGFWRRAVIARRP